LLLQRFKFIHTHIHDIISCIWIDDHLTQIRRKLLKVNVIVRITAHSWTHGVELLLRHVSHNSGWISILFSDLSLLFQVIHSLLKWREQVSAHFFGLSKIRRLTLPIKSRTHASIWKPDTFFPLEALCVLYYKFESKNFTLRSPRLGIYYCLSLMTCLTTTGYIF
jgi:hypothetical protein